MQIQTIQTTFEALECNFQPFKGTLIIRMQIRSVRTIFKPFKRDSNQSNANSNHSNEIRTVQMQIRTFKKRDSNHSKANWNHSNKIRSIRMQIRTIRTWFEALKCKFEQFKRHSKHLNATSNHLKGILNIRMQIRIVRTIFKPFEPNRQNKFWNTFAQQFYCSANSKALFQHATFRIAVRERKLRLLFHPNLKMNGCIPAAFL